MSARRKRLTVVGIKAIKGSGRYNDGDGLYLLIKADGRRTWVFRYRDRVTGKLRDKGLGPLKDVTLEAARAAAAAQRLALRAGIDPIESSKQKLAELRIARAKETSFGECCTAYIAAHKAGWRNAKHASQWRSTLDTYCVDLLALPVQAIDTDLVLKALEPIWTAKTETATRVRQRVEAVMDWATARKFRQGENPARWRGHLDKLLAKPSKVKKVEHRAALQYADLPLFMAALAIKDTLGSMGLGFQILTATRPGEAIGARWSEVDFDRKLWTIPAERMKANREHRIPLSQEAIKLLKSIPRLDETFVFPGKPKRSLTTAASLAILQELHPDLTAHGFRSTFRVWCAERTAYPREVAEAALAHVLKDKTEAAYHRSDILNIRQRLMADWGRFCRSPIKSTGVKPIRNKTGLEQHR